MGVAFFMTSPTAEQLQAARAGRDLPIVGAHSVGVADGGAGPAGRRLEHRRRRPARRALLRPARAAGAAAPRLRADRDARRPGCAARDRVALVWTARPGLPRLRRSSPPGRRCAAQPLLEPGRASPSAPGRARRRDRGSVAAVCHAPRSCSDDGRGDRMSWELAFSLAAPAGRTTLAADDLLPTWAWTERIIGSPWSFAPLAVVYAVLVIPRLGELIPVIVLNPSWKRRGPAGHPGRRDDRLGPFPRVRRLRRPLDLPGQSGARRSIRSSWARCWSSCSCSGRSASCVPAGPLGQTATPGMDEPPKLRSGATPGAAGPGRLTRQPTPPPACSASPYATGTRPVTTDQRAGWILRAPTRRIRPASGSGEREQ